MTEYLRNIIGTNNEIFILALLVVLGLILAELANKIHLPRISGYILSGIIIGHPFLDLITKNDYKNLQNINLIALGLMSITIGAHLNFHKLKNSGKRVVFVLFSESFLSFFLVFLVMYFISGQELLFSLLIASISIATAPAATVAIVKEAKAKGLLVNTLMPVVAMNNVLCILVFGFVTSLIILSESPNGFDLMQLVAIVGKELFYASIIGIFAGILLKIFAEKTITSNRSVLTLVFLTILVVTGVSKILNINPMLPSMIIGIYISNSSHHRAKILSIFDDIEYLIVIIFFSLAGAHIDVESLSIAGVAAVLYFFARGIGKYFGANFGAFISKAPERVYKNIGSALIPQAGVAIGLVIMAGEIEALNPVISFLTTLVLAVVAINEIVGPPMTKLALIKSGDANQDRPKLIEFLVEDYILSNMKSKNKDDAIIELIDFFIKSHKGSNELKEEISRSVIERENLSSTAIGHGIAIPHGTIKEGPIIWGALGLSKEGIEFDAIDKKPVHLFILIITPIDHKNDLHLAVLSEISKMLSVDEIREKIFASNTAAEICETLIHQENRNFNPFLDEDEQ